MFLPTQHRGRERRLLLDLSWGGQTYRLASSPETFTDAAGASYDYAGGLVIDEAVPLEAAIRSAEGPPLSVPAMLHLEGLVNVPEQVSKGWELGAATCKLWVWLKGTSTRVLLLDGVLDDPEWGRDDEPVNASLLDTRRENLQRFPASTARITATTWPHLYGRSVEQWYPWVLGTPGDEATGAWGSPCLVVDTTLSVGATDVKLDFDEGSGEVTATLSAGTYTPAGLRDEIATEMIAAGAQNYTVSIEAGTGRWTIATDAGSTVTLLWSSGTNNADTVGDVIGADTSSDTTDLQSHTLANRASGTPRRLLVAGHAVQASTVRVLNANDNTEEDLTVTNETDGLGRTVATVDLSTGSNITVDIGGSYYARWPAGGLAYRGSTLEGGGDLLAWALEQTDLRVDRGSLETVRSRLNTYKFGGYLMADPNARVDLWAWARTHLLRFMPVSAIEGPHGLGFVLWDWGATESALLITDDDNGVIDGRLSYGPRDGIRNEFRLNYALDANGREPTRRHAISGDRNDSAATFSRLCAESRQRHGGPRKSPRVWEDTAAYIYDPATAARVCHDLAAELAPRWFSCSVRVEPQAAAHLRRGDMVTLTSEDHYLTARRCFVVGTPVDEGEWVRLTLRSLR